MNWYKKAQNWYTKEVAQTTKDPQILTNILRVGNKDSVSCYAAQNPNCPKEILKEVLRRRKDDIVSNYAAENPNCHPEALAEVLERGEINSVSEKAAANPNCPPEALKKVVTDALNKERDNWVSQYAAGNPNCPTEILKQILMRGKDDGLSAYAASNPNCPPEILAEVFKKVENGRVSQCAALNPNCPPEVLIGILSRDKNNDSVSYSAIKNPNCPPEAFTKVLIRGVVDRVSCDAARDKRCPKEILIEVLRRKNDNHVSFYAAHNPNCPDEEKIKWMQATGKIEKEDESKGHIIEYEKTNPEDDLSDLKKLLGKTFNLKKYAQHEDGFYYEEIEIVKHTKDPKILIDILRREKDDAISRYAAKNPNCPPEMLIEILIREENDGVSWRAASNPNCPKEMLTEVLRREKDNLVSVYAAINPNCPLETLIKILRREKNDEVSRWAASNPSLPPEILIEILKKGKDDYISQGSVENPNCPDEEKIKWMQATGKIEKEDESKGHIIEYEKTNQEDDLSDLKNLLSKNIKLNKYAQDEIDYPNIDRIKELAKKIDMAYKNKQFENIEEMEQELEMLIERTSDIQEEKLVEGGGEVEGYDIEGGGMDRYESPSLEELLANGYLEYINFDENKYKSFGSKQDIISNMRKNIEYYDGFAKKNITDKMILDAAKDAYERKVNLINKHKKYKKARSSHMSWYKKAQANIQDIDADAQDFMVDIGAKEKSVPANIKRMINNEIHKLGNYHVEIPLNQIFEICKRNNVIVLQEDGTPWAGFLSGNAECGSEKAKNQRATFALAYKKDDKYVPVNNSISLTWCTMRSGKYEVICYIS